MTIKPFTIQVRQTSQTGQSIFILWQEGDRPHLPTLSLQMPTDVANFMKEAANKKQKENCRCLGTIICSQCESVGKIKTQTM